MCNLWEETLIDLEKQGLCWGDVEYIVIGDVEVPKDHYKNIADNEYYAGFGGHEVHDRLKIVGKDWWLERWEYDGSEGFEFKKMIERPKEVIEVDKEFLFFETRKTKYTFQINTYNEYLEDKKMIEEE